MDYRDLLDKPMQLQVQILRDIYAQTQGLSKRALLDKYQLSQPTLKAYLSELTHFCAAHFPGALSLVDVDGQLKLVKATSVGLPNIIYAYLKNADAFKILALLQQQGRFTYLELEEQLAISSASIYRKIADLNRVLKEFKLSIQNGQMQGSEWQIRYFYYQLTMQLVPFEHLIDGMNDPKILRVLADFEAGMHFSLPLAARTKFYTWMKITLTRYQTGQVADFRQNANLPQSLTGAPFYRQFHQVLRTIGPKNDFQRTDQDIAVLYLASFCFGFLPDCADRYLEWAEGGDTVNFPFGEALHRTSSFLLKHYRMGTVLLGNFQKIRYLLIQSILHYVLFQGFIYPYSDEQLESEINRQASTEFVTVATSYLTKMAPLWRKSAFLPENPLYRNLTYRIQAAFRYTDFLTDQTLKVGLRFFTDLLIQELFLTLWSRKLNRDFSVQLEFFQPNTNYDLIITDYLLPTDDKARCFLISEFDHENDITAIRRILAGLYDQRK